MQRPCAPHGDDSHSRTHAPVDAVHAATVRATRRRLALVDLIGADVVVEATRTVALEAVDTVATRAAVLTRR